MKGAVAGNQLYATVAVVGDEDVADVVDAQALRFAQHVRPGRLVGEDQTTLWRDALDGVGGHVRHHVVAVAGKRDVARLHEDGVARAVHVEGFDDVTALVDDVDGRVLQAGHQELVQRGGVCDGVVLFHRPDPAFQRHGACKDIT